MAMYRVVIEKVKEEAQALITACDAALAQIDKENVGRSRWDHQKEEMVKDAEGPRPGDRSWGSRATGDLRRKSMDLTRLLADLRRSS